jgi:hypothetical protein
MRRKECSLSKECWSGYFFLRFILLLLITLLFMTVSWPRLLVTSYIVCLTSPHNLSRRADSHLSCDVLLFIIMEPSAVLFIPFALLDDNIAFFGECAGAFVLPDGEDAFHGLIGVSDKPLM